MELCQGLGFLSEVMRMGFLWLKRMERKNEPDLSGKEYPDKAILTALILYIALFAAIIFRLSVIRAFNFDEFQVLYASASLIRGKALYADHIGNHFPLVNILFSLLIKTLGFHTSTVLAARLFTLLFFYTTLFFIFKVTELLWDRLSGILAVALVMAAIVFVDKGIEVRHDVFNMTFNTIGAYFGLKYLQEKKPHFVCFSGLFLGLALASTQKAVVWNIGIIVGLFFSMIRLKRSKKLPETIALFGGAFVISLAISFGYLLLVYGENFKACIEAAVIDAGTYLSPEKANEVYPFAYARFTVLKSLFRENGFFYLLSLLGLLASLIEWFRRGALEGVIGFWALAGILFYLYISRPFLQSLLPTVPVFGILAAGFIRKSIAPFKQHSWTRKPLVGLVALVLMLGWPSYIIAFKLEKNRTMTEQMENITFCLSNLEPDDKVLCFSQQQIFFDPVFRFYGDECGRSIHEFDAKCFEREMIRQKCKVVINDKRTKSLSKIVQGKLKNHFLPASVGNIFVPGFLVEPQSVVEWENWVEGPYYSPTREVMIDGKKIEDNVIDLEQKTYVFENPTHRPVYLFYIFDREKFIEHLAKKGTR
jgi:hypothetical protein